MSNLQSDRAQILLAAQSSLLGEVFPSLISVDVSWYAHQIELKFYIDSEPSEPDLESVSAIEAEMNAHFPAHDIAIVLAIGHPRPENRGDVCVFARRP